MMALSIPQAARPASRTAAPTAPARFTVDGTDALERQVRRLSERVLAEVRGIIPPGRFEALLLGGGYGRGEGGVLRTRGGDRPYNDLEFYLCVRGHRLVNRRRYGPALQQLLARLSREAGLEVEITIISLALLRAAPVSMFYYDLVSGHRWLWGQETDLAGCERHRQSALLPAGEAIRLLLNRCTGLLLAREKLRRLPLNEEDLDFVARNLAKLQLALGDAVLTMLGQYHWSCRERHDRLMAAGEGGRLAWLDEVRRHHEMGVEFKLHPRRHVLSVLHLDSLTRELTELAREVWLWVESRRLGRVFSSTTEYALSEVSKNPETNPWRNRLLNGRLLGWHCALLPGSRRNPRERVLHALALLLWDGIGNAALLRRLQEELRTRAAEREALVKRYWEVWEECR